MYKTIVVQKDNTLILFRSTLVVSVAYYFSGLFSQNDPIFISTISSLDLLWFKFASTLNLNCSAWIFNDYKAILWLLMPVWTLYYFFSIFSLLTFFLISTILKSLITSNAFLLIVCDSAADFFTLSTLSYFSLNFIINGDCLICNIFFFISKVLNHSHSFITFLNKPKPIAS